MIYGKQLTYWWFSELKTDYSGIAWYGKNKVSEGIGLSWCAINNPEPQKQITSLVIEAPAGNGIYTIFAISVSDRRHQLPVNPVSYGGPDNWAAATAMAAMVEGLAGVKNTEGTRAYSVHRFHPGGRVQNQIQRMCVYGMLLPVVTWPTGSYGLEIKMKYSFWSPAMEKKSTAKYCCPAKQIK